VCKLASSTGQQQDQVAKTILVILMNIHKHLRDKPAATNTTTTIGEQRRNRSMDSRYKTVDSKRSRLSIATESPTLSEGQFNNNNNNNNSNGVTKDHCITFLELMIVEDLAEASKFSVAIIMIL
jgi:hypothetical protein